VLEHVNNVEDLKKLDKTQKIELAKDIRKELINVTSKTGGHLASNLGVVELTIALHSVFDVPQDKIVWDVGHQTYVHKMLTGRKDKLHTIRQLDGISGFPKTCESIYDCFDTGHSSTSISIALGMARANAINKIKNRVIAVIGDGALTGGMALEALNDAGSSNANILVVLNDNEMSISKNVGGVRNFLTKLRTKKFYKKTNNVTKKVLNKVPLLGSFSIKLARRIKQGIKQIFIPNMFFEDIGFTYFGPVDGHDIEKLESILNLANSQEGPILVHVITTKGKGYEIAELDPGKFHAISKFNIDTGELESAKAKDYSSVFGNKLVELATKDEKIVAVTAAMADGTGLKDFSEKFPNRFFDVGIAEEHAARINCRNGKTRIKASISRLFFVFAKSI
jgi:1-deoxy-D-xylulose-5-phosphate synthase